MGGRPIVPPAGAKEIKCDKCGKAFPSNVDESVLVHHIKTVHLKQKNWACLKCDKAMASEMALKYHSCSERFKCTDCNKLFMLKSTLFEHQAVAHRPVMEEPNPSPEKPKPEVRKLIEDDWEDEEDEENIDDPKEDPMAEVTEGVNGHDKESDTDNSRVTATEECKEKEENVSEEVKESSGEPVETKDNEKTDSGESPKKLETDQSEISDDKGDEDDEDKIVADVDDILNDTENLVSDMNDIVSEKRKTSVIRKREEFITSPQKYSSPSKKVQEPDVEEPVVKKPRISTKQCETCYECFETEEKLAWHDLNEHAPPPLKPDEDTISNSILDEELDI